MDLLTPTTEAPGHLVVWRPADVAAYWQRSPSTIMRWADSGDHPPPRTDPGGAPYWLPDEVKAFARGDAAGPTGDARRARSHRSEQNPPVFELVVGDRRQA